MKKQLSTTIAGCLVLSACLLNTAFGQTIEELNIRQAFRSKVSFSSGAPEEFVIQRKVNDDKRQLNFYYIQQTHNGLPILNGTAVLVEKNNQFKLASSRLLTQTFSETKKNLKSKEAILDQVWLQLGNTTTGGKTEKIQDKSKLSFSNSFYSEKPIPVSDAYYFDGQNYRRVYQYNIEMKNHLEWWDIYADASTGEILFKNNWVVSCSVENCNLLKHETNQANSSIPHFLQMVPAPAPPPSTDSYRALPLPVESPVHGNFELIVGPSDPIASPFGWHDDNGVAGPEYTITRGNNVYAAEDTSDLNSPGYSPDGGANLVFDFPITNTSNPTSYLDASITNLFYMNNMMHDIYYQYGFDESSGNFQQNNYGKGGAGNDFVFADAQDGSGTNNANFGTPSDGSNPRMQMYIWDGGAPARLLTINPDHPLEGKYATGKANFGTQVSSTPLTAQLVLASDSTGSDPIDACTQVKSIVAGKIAYVRKGGCANDIKAVNCEAAGAIGMVVMNTSLGNPPNMTVTNPAQVNIPCLMLGNNPGVNLLTSLQNGDSVSITLYDHGWYGTTDSDLDNMIIAHEYGHGISNRLTGGPNNSSCLFNQEQMGEGWSDYVGLVLTIKPDDVSSKKRGVGTFVSNEENDGTGIRPRPYTTSFGVNSYTYGATNNPSISRPHGIGFVWATMLWDMTWALIDKYGFDPNLYTGTGGNNRAMNLVINGMKLQPCGPGFVDGRDAILLANELLYDSLDQCMLWSVFAKRGLGANANQGNANSRDDQTEDFSMPAFCTAGMSEKELLEQSLRVYPNPTEGNLFVAIDELQKMNQIELRDINGRLIQQLIDLQTSQVSFDISSLQSGVYFLTIQVGQSKLVRKVVKN